MAAGTIVLVGFMGAGKSSVGRLLARRLRRRFVETDDVIVAREGRPIPEIFRTDGEGRFRQLEGAVVEALTRGEAAVVATGGGLPCREDRMARLRALGTVIWLKSDVGVALERARRSGQRPMLEGRSLEDIEALYRQREPYYAQADIVVETDGLGVDQVVAAILARLRIPHAARP